MLRRLAPVALALFSLACGAAGSAVSPKAPEANPDEGPPGSARPEPQVKQAGLGELPPGVPAPPALCEGFVGAAPKDCGAGSFEDRLAAALSQQDAARDAALRCLESAAEAPPGWVRSLRADLAPREC